jgi:hypothetical protein
MAPEQARLLETPPYRVGTGLDQPYFSVTIKLLDFVHRPDFYKQKTQHFGNWICFRNVVFSVCRNPDDGQSPEA